MYGPVKSYRSNDTVGAYVKIPDNMDNTNNPTKRVSFLRRGNLELKVTVDHRGTWIEATRYYMADGLKCVTLKEYLFSPIKVTKEIKPNIFILTDRKADARVPMTAVARRHRLYPNGKKVRLK